MGKRFKPYFNSTIYRNLLEDLYLPPYAKSLLYPNTFRGIPKQTFLTKETKVAAEAYIQRRKKHLDEWIEHEFNYYVGSCELYIKAGEKEEERWLKDLRAEFDLPADYEFDKRFYY